MCTLATEQTSTWLMVDPWEAVQSYQRTAVVLDHFDYEINTKLGGVTTAEGEQRHVRIFLLAGSDLIATMSEPGVWSEADVRLSILLSPPHPYISAIWLRSAICRAPPFHNPHLSGNHRNMTHTYPFFSS